MKTRVILFDDVDGAVFRSGVAQECAVNRNDHAVERRKGIGAAGSQSDHRHRHYGSMPAARPTWFVMPKGSSPRSARTREAISRRMVPAGKYTVHSLERPLRTVDTGRCDRPRGNSREAFLQITRWPRAAVTKASAKRIRGSKRSVGLYLGGHRFFLQICSFESSENRQSLACSAALDASYSYRYGCRAEPSPVPGLGLEG